MDSEPEEASTGWIIPCSLLDLYSSLNISKVTRLLSLLKVFPTGTLEMILFMLPSPSYSLKSSESESKVLPTRFFILLDFSLVLLFLRRIYTESIVLVSLWGFLDLSGVCMEWYFTSLESLIEF